jgi:hypothetical protein
MGDGPYILNSGSSLWIKAFEGFLLSSISVMLCGSPLEEGCHPIPLRVNQKYRMSSHKI